jgi:hypothetical protein
MDRTATRRHPLIAATAAFALILSACGSAQAPSPQADASAAATASATLKASTAPGPVVSAVPTPVESPPADRTPNPISIPTPTPTPTPTPVTSPAPTPTPIDAAGWTSPQRVGTATHCIAITAEIDELGGYHAAAECEGAIHYYYSTNSGQTWTARVFALAAHREEVGPLIAVDGSVVYVAYTRYIPDGGCGGGRGLSVGVYYRSRVLPGGAWSAAKRIGTAADELESFQVAAGTLHATVRGHDGLSYYENLKGSTYGRYRISRLPTGPVSMRVGSDGRARFTYAGSGIRYAVFNGSGFSASRVAGSTGYDTDPLAALDGNDKGHLVWTRYEPAACGNSPVGTYYATNASGSWKIQRISKESGVSSIQVDRTTGRIHVLIAGTYYTKTASSGTWTRTVLAVPAWGQSAAALRLDPVSGTLLVVYIDGSSSAPIKAMTSQHCGC